MAVIVQRRPRHLDQQQDICRPGLGRAVEVIAKSQNSDVRLRLGIGREPDQVLGADERSPSEPLIEEEVETDDPADMVVTDGRHLVQLSVQQFDALVLSNDAGFAHALVFVGGEPSPGARTPMTRSRSTFIQPAASASVRWLHCIGSEWHIAPARWTDMRRWYDGGSRNQERPTMTTRKRPLRDDGPYLWDLEPQTDLGRLLLECRRELVAKGEPLLDWEESSERLRVIAAGWATTTNDARFLMPVC
ncbi:MAG: hypothetical protein U0531_16085 [Dehalococcoidia bacterium]